MGFRELLDFAQEESRRWHDWFNKNPRALDVKVDIATAPDVRTLLLHVVACELYYAEWLSGDRITPWQNISADSADGLFAAAENASVKFRTLTETATEEQWSELLAFPKRIEGLKASRRKCFVHTILHSVRHWAQLATALRSAGFKQDWQHDFLFTSAME